MCEYCAPTPPPYRQGNPARFAVLPERAGGTAPKLYVYLCGCLRYYSAFGMPAHCVCGAEAGTMALIPVTPDMWPYTAWSSERAAGKSP